MSEKPQTLTVHCQAVSSKMTLPETLCAAFRNRLAQAYPALRFELLPAATSASQGDVTLQVQHLSATGMEARILWGEAAGAPQGMAAADRVMQPADIEKFLDHLLQATPRP